jgi:hypothetical protein
VVQPAENAENKVVATTTKMKDTQQTPTTPKGEAV